MCLPSYYYPWYCWSIIWHTTLLLSLQYCAIILKNSNVLGGPVGGYHTLHRYRWKWGSRPRPCKMKTTSKMKITLKMKVTSNKNKGNLKLKTISKMMTTKNKYDTTIEVTLQKIFTYSRGIFNFALLLIISFFISIFFNLKIYTTHTLS